jgi:DNA-binding NtrC family response regulator
VNDPFLTLQEPEAHDRLDRANGDGPGNPGPFPLVLVVDDRARDRIEFERLLRRWGFRPLSVASHAGAAQALALYRFSAVLADLNLGLGEPDGLDVLRLAQRVQPAAARFLVTADALGATMVWQVEGRWYDKDSPPLELVEMLKEAIGAR